MPSDSFQNGSLADPLEVSLRRSFLMVIGIVARNIRNFWQDLWFAFFTFQTRDFISKIRPALFFHSHI